MGRLGRPHVAVTPFTHIFYIFYIFQIIIIYKFSISSHSRLAEKNVGDSRHPHFDPHFSPRGPQVKSGWSAVPNSTTLPSSFSSIP